MVGIHRASLFAAFSAVALALSACSGGSAGAAPKSPPAVPTSSVTLAVTPSATDSTPADTPTTSAPDIPSSSPSTSRSADTATDPGLEQVSLKFGDFPASLQTQQIYDASLIVTNAGSPVPGAMLYYSDSWGIGDMQVQVGAGAWQPIRERADSFRGQYHGPLQLALPSGTTTIHLRAAFGGVSGRSRISSLISRAPGACSYSRPRLRPRL